MNDREKTVINIFFLLLLIGITTFFLTDFFLKDFYQTLFFSISVPMTLFYTLWKENIFNWSPDPDYEFKDIEFDKDGNKVKETIKINFESNRRNYIDKRARLVREKAPPEWVIEGYIHVFFGLVLGWIFFWILLKRLGIFDGTINFSALGLIDLFLFIGGWIGINGRLPTIAQDVQNWFKR